jgi:hypothetical protein
MLDLARNSGRGLGVSTDFDAELNALPSIAEAKFEPEQPIEPDQSYDGEFKFVNLGPQKLAQMKEEDVSPRDRMAFQVARRYWGMQEKPQFVAGSVDRGDDLPVRKVAQLSDLVGKTAAVVKSMGSLSAGGTPSLSSEPRECAFDWVDFGELAAFGPLPQVTDDASWF